MKASEGKNSAICEGSKEQDGTLLYYDVVFRDVILVSYNSLDLRGVFHHFL